MTTPIIAAVNAATLPELVDPALIKRGVRLFVFLLVKMLKTYAKYQAVIDPVLPSGVATGLGTLIAALAEISALNRPGPE
jgi:hypothetical protein